MNSWYSLDLGDALTAEIDIARIRERLDARRAADNGLGHELVFLRYCNRGGLHCEVTAYFGPALADIAREFGAVPCGTPPTQDLAPLVR